MENTALLRRMGHILSDLLGLGMEELIGPDERRQNVCTTAAIGTVVGGLFALFNGLAAGMVSLGIAEGATILLLVIPAWLMGHFGKHIRLAEEMILIAALIICAALMMTGGIEGTGLLWLYIFPFLVFFLKGQRTGWYYSMAFLALIIAYFTLLAEHLPGAHQYPPIFISHFLLALLFYTLIASSFNLLRTRFEKMLQARVVAKTAAAQSYLSQLQFLATHDTLTKLPNRIRLLEILEDELRQAEARQSGLLICNVRVERLFEFGNVLGLDGADELMRQVADHFREVAGDDGLLARTRRDEFIIVRRIAHPSAERAALQPYLIEPQLSVMVQGYSLHIGFTMGLSISPIHSPEPQELLKKAEQAMLQARQNGLSWDVYDAQQEAKFVRHHLLFGKLREAIPYGDLRVYFQPQIDLATGRLIGAEALSRWQDPDEGAIPPDVFIPVAEESGLIRPLTAWLARASMYECARWHAEGIDIDISINISALSLLDPELLSGLLSAAETARLPTHFVNLELTESCFLVSLDRAKEIMMAMHDAGFGLSIDDYGTGFSSLSYLKHLPINELKIDQSFVRKLLDTPGDQAIVESTIALAHNFNLKVVAEGVEDDTTADWLRRHGCDIGQGYGFARPMPADQFLEFARNNRARFDLALENQ